MVRAIIINAVHTSNHAIVCGFITDCSVIRRIAEIVNYEFGCRFVKAATISIAHLGKVQFKEKKVNSIHIKTRDRKITQQTSDNHIQNNNKNYVNEGNNIQKTHIFNTSITYKQTFTKFKNS